MSADGFHSFWMSLCEENTTGCFYENLLIVKILLLTCFPLVPAFRKSPVTLKGVPKAASVILKIVLKAGHE
jgi:hypothetical protein